MYACTFAPLLREYSSKGIKQVPKLPEEDETLFRQFQLWVYTKKLLAGR